MKTVSKELALQLKQAGFPQDSYLGFYEPFDEPTISNAWKNFTDGFASPTAEEILEQLPVVLDKHCYLKIFRQDNPGNYNEKYWHIAYNENKHACGKPNQMAWQFEKSLAEAAGKMYLYLKKEGLL